MGILIDGYNLLHAAGLLGRNVGPGTLERSRHALLNCLAALLDETERAGTTVVFDAKAAPPGLPREQQVRGLRVLYAVGYDDADALLAELIRADSTPRRLVVVSSDHQVQRAAKRRRATAIDSDRWYEDLRLRRRPNDPRPPAEEQKPVPINTEHEVAYWLEIFGDAEISDEPRDAASATDAAEEIAGKPDIIVDDSAADIANPFPPGYGEDLLTDDE